MKRFARNAVLTTLLVLAHTTAWADKATTIWFTKNYDAANPAECVASTVTKKQTAQRNEPVKWKLKSDPDNECPNFDPKRAYLLFSTDVVGAGAKRKIYGQANGQVDAKTTTDKVIAPDDSKHLYKIYYKDKMAEDPELDIKGDMPPGPKR